MSSRSRRKAKNMTEAMAQTIQTLAKQEPAIPSRPVANLMTPALLAQFVGVQIGELAEGMGGKPTQYQLFSDGLYKTTTLPMGVVRVQTAQWTDPTLPAKPKDFNLGFTLTLPKIPAQLLLQITAFFKAVNTKHQSEAYASVFWTGTDYVVHVPEQTVTKAGVKHLQDRDILGEQGVLEIHSHDTMSAFFSGTDDHDEIGKGQRCYGVLGKIDQTIPESKWRVRFGHAFLEIALADLFEFPDYEVTHTIGGAKLFTMVGSVSGRTVQSMSIDWDPCEGITFPDEWMEQVKEPTIVIGGSSYPLADRGVYGPYPMGGKGEAGKGSVYKSTKEWIEHLQAGHGSPRKGNGKGESWWASEARQHLRDAAEGKVNPGAKDLRLWNSDPDDPDQIERERVEQANLIMQQSDDYGRYFAD
jgi:PRTRC genetic system protein A